MHQIIIFNTFGTCWAFDFVLLVLLKYNLRNAVDDEFTTASDSDPLEFPGLFGCTIAIAITLEPLPDDVAVDIATWACVTETVIALCVPAILKLNSTQKKFGWTFI